MSIISERLGRVEERTEKTGDYIETLQYRIAEMEGYERDRRRKKNLLPSDWILIAFYIVVVIFYFIMIIKTQRR